VQAAGNGAYKTRQHSAFVNHFYQTYKLTGKALVFTKNEDSTKKRQRKKQTRIYPIRIIRCAGNNSPRKTDYYSNKGQDYAWPL
jgi:hypothetical protein